MKKDPFAGSLRLTVADIANQRGLKTSYPIYEIAVLVVACMKVIVYIWTILAVKFFCKLMILFSCRIIDFIYIPKIYRIMIIAFFCIFCFMTEQVLYFKAWLSMLLQQEKKAIFSGNKRRTKETNLSLYLNNYDSKRSNKKQIHHG